MFITTYDDCTCFLTGSKKFNVFFSTGAVTCTDVDMHKIVSGSSDRTVKVMFLLIFSAFCNC